jgi:uncharacterized membrane-anchored protein
MAALGAHGPFYYSVLTLSVIVFLFYIGLSAAIAITKAHFLEEFRNQFFHVVNLIFLLVMPLFRVPTKGRVARLIRREVAYAWIFIVCIVATFDVFAMWDNGRRLADLKTIIVGSHQQSYWIACLVRLGLCFAEDLLTLWYILTYRFVDVE